MPSSIHSSAATPSPGLWSVGSGTLRDFGISPIGLVRRILELEGRIYSVEAHGHVGSAIDWAPVFEANPESWGALTNEDEQVVAYWRIASLEPLAFDRAQAGLLEPFDISPHDCEDLSEPGIHNIYIVRSCIDPAWREISVRQIFVDSFFAAVERLALRGVRFGKVTAIAHSDDECRICEEMGLEFQHDAPDDAAVFGGSFAQALARLGPAIAHRPKLLQAYMPKAAPRLARAG